MTRKGLVLPPLKISRDQFFGYRRWFYLKKYTDESYVETMFQKVYPVGSIYMSMVATNPSDLFGFGEWEQIKDTFLLSAGDSYDAGDTGGDASVALSTTQVPKVNGTIYMHAQAVATDVHKVEGCFYPQLTNEGAYVTGDDKVAVVKTGADSIGIIRFDNGGTGASHNNMPPYFTVYMWKRVS